MDDSTSPRMMNRTEATYFLLDLGRALSETPGYQLEPTSAKCVEALHVLGCTRDEMKMAVTLGNAGVPSGVADLQQREGSKLDPNRVHALALTTHALYRAGYKPQQAADIIKVLGCTTAEFDEGLAVFERAVREGK